MNEMNLFEENIQRILLDANLSSSSSSALSTTSLLSSSSSSSLALLSSSSSSMMENYCFFNHEHLNGYWCLWIQQQADAHFQNLLKRYNNYIGAAIESCLQFKSQMFLHENISQQPSTKHSITIEKNCSIIAKRGPNVACNLDFNNQKNHDNQMLFECDWPGCDRKFKTEQILNHHRRFHIRKSNYHCKHCSVRLLSRKELVEHMIKCEINSKDGECIANAPITIEDNHQDDQISNNVINNNNKKNNDDKSIANVTSNLVLESDNRKSLIDQLISPRNTKNRELKKALLAIKTSNKTKPLKSNEYKRTRYSGIGRYRCPWPDCTYTPHFLRDLRRHMFKHTGDKRYKCPDCRFVSVWKTSLLQHQRKKHMTDIQSN